MSSSAQLPPPESPSVPKPAPARAGVVAAVSLTIAVLGLAAFGWIADEVFLRHQLDFDNTVREAVHAVASPGLTRFMRALTFLGSPASVIAIYVVCIALFLRARWKRAAGWLTLTLIGATIIDVALKLAFHRTRPVAFFGTSPSTFSFPSGHAAGAVCFFGVLAGMIAGRIRHFVARIALWAAAVTLVIGIGVSRIYLGVHYPTDVAAGYAAAAFWVATLVWLDRLRARRIKLPRIEN